MAIILDTNTLWHPSVLAALPGPAVLPAVAFAERARQILRDGRDLGELWSLLAAAQVTVEPFSETQATRCAMLRPDEVAWSRHGRDALIAGHVGPDDVLWTKNPEDFLAVGLPAERIVAC